MELAPKLERVLSEALESRADIEVGTEEGVIAEDSFLSIFAAFTSKFGLPDFPGSAPDHDWRTELGLDAQLLAIWDFDYYQLSLRLQGRRILLRHHSAEGQPAA